MSRYELDKNILEFILEKDIPFERIEDVFYELYLINPHSSDASLSELTLYPDIYFHSKDICHEMEAEFEKLLLSDEKSISRKRFRAFLALIYLKGMRERHFNGYKRFLEISENVSVFAYAYEVFKSENFKANFLKYDSLLANKDV